MSGSEVLLYQKKDRIVTITLNRPERANALSLELMLKLEQAWKQFDQDEDAWVAIITGAGDKGFCPGADLMDMAELMRKGAPMPLTPPVVTPAGIWKPVICALNGFAVAGGFWIAHDCDIRIAAEHVEMGVSETAWNVPAYWVFDLTKNLNLGHALEIALWGDRRMSAQRAYEIGLVNRVVPKEKLMAEAQEWAERMLNLGPRCVRNLKQIIYRGRYLPPQDGKAFGMALEENLKGMKDSLEGGTAFAERRKPKYQNK